MKSRLIGQIHDSGLGDVPDKELQNFLDISKKVMTVDLLKHWPWICVPLESESDVTPAGYSWHEKQPWICKEGVWQAKV